ncbi:MAG: dipeptidase [Candidatus Hydrogenedentes bacterium]|nr:dipeptidase [Candidatus Hydrogenedentota bacterium]
MNQAIDYARSNSERYLEEFKALLRVPSVSTLPEHKDDVERTARWLAVELQRVGIPHVEILPTAGHPAVFAEIPGPKGSPTALVYGHYDVQPVDPVHEWVSPPFEPTVRGDYLFARGASDMKGQIFAQIKAMEALLKHGSAPCTIKYLIEGEEEIGSPNLGWVVDTYIDKLRCDFVLNCDAGIHKPDVPAITYSLRGLAYFEVEVFGPSKDLHSGLFGGSVHNPAQALCELIAGMHDAEGRVTLPGFYDKVRALDIEEREALAKLPHSDEEWKAMTGAPALWGEKGYTTIERVGARPTLEVNGILSGFTGEGSKTVLPAKAMAKISTRLVADQDGAEVHAQLCEYLKRNAPPTVRWEVRELTHGKGAIMDRRSPWMQKAVAALVTVFGKEPIFKREGGSVPVVSLLQQKLGADSVMLGFALPDDGIHGPNERQHLPTFYRGIETYIRFLSSLGTAD